MDYLIYLIAYIIIIFVLFFVIYYISYNLKNMLRIIFYNVDKLTYKYIKIYYFNKENIYKKDNAFDVLFDNQKEFLNSFDYDFKTFEKYFNTLKTDIAYLEKLVDVNYNLSNDYYPINYLIGIFSKLNKFNNIIVFIFNILTLYIFFLFINNKIVLR